MYRENPERDFEVVRAVAAAIIGQLDTLSPYILLISLVKSQLSYCSQIWRPNFINNIILLEKVQRRATKYIIIQAATSLQDF